MKSSDVTLERLERWRTSDRRRNAVSYPNSGVRRRQKLGVSDASLRRRSTAVIRLVNWSYTLWRRDVTRRASVVNFYDMWTEFGVRLRLIPSLVRTYDSTCRVSPIIARFFAEALRTRDYCFSKVPAVLVRCGVAAAYVTYYVRVRFHSRLTCAGSSTDQRCCYKKG